MENKKIILIPTDFSEACNNAIEHGVEIAKAYECELHILHVINKDTKLHLVQNKLSEEYLVLQLKNIATKIENEHNIFVRTTFKAGSIFNEINKTAKETGSRLIVLGTHGKKGFQKIFGSFAMRIIQHSPIPVIVVQKRSFAAGYKNIVFPVNISIEYEEKVKWALNFADVFKSTVHIYKFNETNKELQNNIEEIGNKICKSFDEKNVDYTVAYAKNESNFSGQLIDYSVSNNADIILIMTNNDEFEPSFILGAPEEKMIFNPSQIPVMCINPKK